MANLSNINNVLRVSSDLRVGINTDAASYALEIGGTNSGIKLKNSGGSGKVYSLLSDTSGNFQIYDDAASSGRLVISSGGDATFAGTISAVGASTFTLNDGIFIKAVNGTNNIAATNIWGYGLYEGASKLGEISLVRDGSSSQMYMGTTGANQVLRIGSANKVTAITIDASQNSTFAGTINGSGIELSNYMQIKVDDAEIYWTNTANNDYWRWKRDASNNFILDHYNGSSTTSALSFNSSQNSTFAGSVTTTGLTVQAGTYHKVITSFPSTYKTNLQIGQQLNISNDAITDTVTFANTGTEAVSEFIFTIAGNEKLKIDGTGKATFRSTYIIPGFYGGEVTVGGSANIFGLQLKYDQNASTTSTLYHSPGYVNNDNLFKLGSGSGNTNQLVLKGDGNVGIGTASPGVPLHVVRTSAGQAFRLQQTGSNLYTEMQFQTPTGNMYMFVNSSGYSSYGGANATNFYTSNGAFAFHSNAGNNHFYIANGGNVGIGTTGPATKLTVKGATQFGGNSTSTAALTSEFSAYGTTQNLYSITLQEGSVWSPGIAVINFAASRSGLQKHYAGQIIVRLTYYNQSGVAGQGGWAAPSAVGAVVAYSGQAETYMRVYVNGTNTGNPQTIQIGVRDIDDTTNYFVSDIRVTLRSGALTITS